ncbi:MAG: tail fiber protein [Bacillota bacterium]|nr:tail fiber protein [Bacillota bacterium]
MADYTTNYNLVKPGQDDFYNVQDFNGNADIIDEQLTALSNSKQDLITGDVVGHYHSSDRNRANHTGTQTSSTISDFAAAVRATVLTGLSTATSAVISAADSALTALGKLQAQISSHLANTSNPHSVTKAQVGLGSVDNTADSAKSVASAAKLTTARTIALSGELSGSANFDGSASISISTAVSNFVSRVTGSVLTGLSTATNAIITASDTVLTALGKLQAQITAHLANTSNPHSVTKAQVGLGNADNTADASKNVLSATKLTTARSINISGELSGSASFDGSAGISIPVKSLVGDIKTTMRTDLGADWLLCNGSAFDSAEYPALASILPFSLSKPWVSTSFTGTANNSKLATDGNIFAFFDGKVIYYTSDITSGSWSSFTVSNAAASITDIKYGGGYWCILCGGYYLYYAASITGTWTLALNPSDPMGFIKYINGSWFTCTNMGKLYYATTPNSTWNSKATNTSSYELSDIAYGNGYYVAPVKGRNIFYYTTSLAGTWSSYTVTSATFYSVDFGNGRFVLGGNSTSSQITFTTPPSTGLAATSNGGSLGFVRYVNGLWFTYGNGALYFAADPTGAWTQVTLSGGADIAYAKGYYVVSTGFTAQVKYSNGYSLPAIASDAYTYIKAQ